jgi:hypothetical protein
MKECRELLLVDSCNLHSAMVIPLVQLNVRVEETNMGSVFIISLWEIMWL